MNQTGILLPEVLTKHVFAREQYGIFLCCHFMLNVFFLILPYKYKRFLFSGCLVTCRIGICSLQMLTLFIQYT